MKLSYAFSVILLITSISAFAESEGLGGGSSGGGVEDKIRLFTASGAPFDAHSTDLVLKCADGITHECPQCKNAIFGVNRADETKLACYCDELMNNYK